MRIGFKQSQVGKVSLFLNLSYPFATLLLLLFVIIANRVMADNKYEI